MTSAFALDNGLDNLRKKTNVTGRGEAIQNTLWCGDQTKANKQSTKAFRVSMQGFVVPVYDGGDLFIVGEWRAVREDQ